jgi:hypothetical protein
MRPSVGMSPRKLFPYGRELGPHHDDPRWGKVFDLSPAITRSMPIPSGIKNILDPRPWRDAGVSRPPGRKCGRDQQDVPGWAVRDLQIGKRLPRTHIDPWDDERRQRLIEPHRRTSDAERSVMGKVSNHNWWH